MKKLIIYIAIFTTVACQKQGVTTPDFEVSVQEGPLTAGKPVKFSFKGNPNFITFFSGETGKQYEYRNRTELTGIPSLNFTTYRQYGAQENSLQLMASTDFNGTYNVAGIQAATWKDLTSRAVLSTGDDNTPSGNIDLSDLVAENKPIYFAFRKHDLKNNLKPRTWTIKTFNISLLTEKNISYPLTTLATAGWLAVDVLNETYKWSITTARLTIGAGNAGQDENDDWVITKALGIGTVPAPPDAGQPVKGIDTYATDFEYVFNEPGTYKVTFLANNQTIHGQESVVKEFSVTITP